MVRPASRLIVAFLVIFYEVSRAIVPVAAEAPHLTNDTFDGFIQGAKHALVKFYAPWCGHCKKMQPDFDQAAGELSAKQIHLVKVDATKEKDLASRYGIKGYPTLVWFEEGKDLEYDGGRSFDELVTWAMSMSSSAVNETVTEDLPEPLEDKPRIVLHGGPEGVCAEFEAAAKAHRRKANWFFVQSGSSGAAKAVLSHRGEEPIELSGACEVGKEKIVELLEANTFPLVGRLDSVSFDRYMASDRGLVWSLFPQDSAGFEATEKTHRPLLTEVAKSVRSNFLVAITDTEKYSEAIEKEFGVTEFPTIAVQRKAGHKKRFLYRGEMTASKIAQFVMDVSSGKEAPQFKSEPVPAPSDDAVKVVVGLNLEKEVFREDTDVVLKVFAPWCGHCKRLEPEYNKLAKKVRKEGLDDLLVFAKLDGTANDSPMDNLDWSGFPSLFLVKAGSDKPLLYEGERSAKSLWKFVKKHATKADELRERLESRRVVKKGAPDEL